jgi:hypothetical protein
MHRNARLSLRAPKSLATRFHTSSSRTKVVRNEGRGGKLTFPVESCANSAIIGKAISWDKTMFMEKLAMLQSVVLVYRPRRFEKSYITTMLSYFHGIEFHAKHDELFNV